MIYSVSYSKAIDKILKKSAHDRIIYDIYDDIVIVEVIQVEDHYNDK